MIPDIIISLFLLEITYDLLTFKHRHKNVENNLVTHEYYWCKKQRFIVFKCQMICNHLHTLIVPTAISFTIWINKRNERQNQIKKLILNITRQKRLPKMLISKVRWSLSRVAFIQSAEKIILFTKCVNSLLVLAFKQ